MSELPLLDAPLRAGGVALRPYAERDIPEILIAYQDDPQLHRLLGQARPPSAAQLGRTAEAAEADRRRGLALWLTICRDGEDRCIGQVSLHSLDWTAASGELSLWLAPGERGCGHGRRALSLAARWLLEHASLSRLELLVDPANEPMKRTAAAVGARVEAASSTAGRSGAQMLRYVLTHPQREP